MSEQPTYWQQPPGWALAEARWYLGGDASTDDLMQYAWEAAERDDPRDDT